MLCPKCSQELPEGSAFCNYCGANLDTPSISSPPSPKPIFLASKAGKIVLAAGAALLVLVIVLAAVLGGKGSVNPVDKYFSLINADKGQEAQKFRKAQDEETANAIEARIVELRDAQTVPVDSAAYTRYVDEYGRDTGRYSPKVNITNKSDLIIQAYVVSYRFYDVAGRPLSDYQEFSDSYANLLSGMSYALSTKNATHCSSAVFNVRACVKEVTFTDGSKWENPYYAVWRAN